MSLSASLVGVLVFLRKESLIGEALSHAAYPGVIIGVSICGILFGDDPEILYVPLMLMSAAFITAILGLKCIQFLELKFRVKQDAALCFVLSFSYDRHLSRQYRQELFHVRMTKAVSESSDQREFI